MGLITTPVRAALRRLGLDVDRHSRSYESRRQRILEHLGVSLVVDVGANIGQYATDLRREGFRGRILSVEPVADSYSSLARRCRRDSRWDCANVALGPEEGECEVHVSGNRVSSSVLPMTALHLEAAPSSEYTGSETVRMCRLDDLLTREQLAAETIAVKIDVQGYERQVLAGGRSVLAVTAVVELEVSLVELYEGQADLQGMLGYMCGQGFRPVGVQSGFVHPGTDETLQLNVLFARNTHAE